MKASIWTGTFWRALGERVLSTGLQAAIPSITLGSLDQVRWGQAELIVGAAALLSLVKGILAGLATGSPGVGSAEVLADPGQTGVSSVAGPVQVDPVQPADLSNLDKLDGLGTTPPANMHTEDVKPGAGNDPTS